MSEDHSSDEIHLPAPTAVPLLLALGLCMLAMGYLQSPAFALVGFGLIAFSAWHWIHLLGPRGHEAVELAPKEAWPKAPAPAGTRVAHLRPGTAGHRMTLPLEVHPYSAGVWAGAIGGIVMAGTAALYGILSGRGIWYPANMLAAIAIPGSDTATIAQLEAFSPTKLGLALAIHAILSLGFGLVHGLLLPMLPSRGILWTGSLLAPLLWTGFLHAFMRVINPVMGEFIDWRWFLLSQLAFGLTVGIVVTRFAKVKTYTPLWMDQPMPGVGPGVREGDEA